MTPEDATSFYASGNIDLTGLLIELGRCLDQEDAPDFVTSLPKDILNELICKVVEFPSSEEEWLGMRVLRSRPGIVA